MDLQTLDIYNYLKSAI